MSPQRSSLLSWRARVHPDLLSARPRIKGAGDGGRGVEPRERARRREKKKKKKKTRVSRTQRVLPPFDSKPSGPVEKE